MPRMKPIEPWYSMFKQIEKALKKPPADITPEELKLAQTARNALWMLAHNREPHQGAVDALRDVLDKKRS